jgi:hypothetical protein
MSAEKHGHMVRFQVDKPGIDGDQKVPLDPSKPPSVLQQKKPLKCVDRDKARQERLLEAELAAFYRLNCAPGVTGSGSGQSWFRR